MALLDLLGRRWVLRVLWELREEPAASFRDLQVRCGNVSSSVLNERLRELRLIERREWPNGPLWRTTRGNRAVREGD